MENPFSSRPSLRWRLVRLGLPAGMSLGAVGLLWSLWPTGSTPPPSGTALAPVATTAVSSVPSTPATPRKPPLRRAFRSGETLGEVLTSLGVEGEEVPQAVEALRLYVDPRRLKPGDVYAATFDDRLTLGVFELHLSGKGRVELARKDGRWQATFDPAERSVLTRVVQGTLQSSLEEAVEQTGAEAALAYQMADVLQWDLDFTRDLRVGDRFEIFFEEILMDGEYHQQGSVVAVRYWNRGRVIEAYRFNDSYYDGEGRPLKKMFLKAPLRFSRVTSPFSHRRFHPVLKTHRPHWGVDYGAPVGTPVHATANGTVTFAAWEGGGGRTIKIRHSGGYLTCYLHLSRFADGIRPGRGVQQGEVIGYVGSTGLSTAPHLDYRVNLNGRWIDPQSLNTVPAKPLSGIQLASFQGYRDQLRTSLASGSPSLPVDSQARLVSTPRPPTTSSVQTVRR
ncbi:MAG TPA: peptidoglycan DD-metalloendopeptidase family protein [Thermoanaerobaculia bacterium]|nr:peptidoglycan DD-metalloendopeptidase family protein [Thermoanaerobaculia bacterium]